MSAECEPANDQLQLKHRTTVRCKSEERVSEYTVGPPSRRQINSAPNGCGLRQVFGLTGARIDERSLSTDPASHPHLRRKCVTGVRSCLPLRGSSGFSPDSLLNTSAQESFSVPAAISRVADQRCQLQPEIARRENVKRRRHPYCGKRLLPAQRLHRR
jgi:hypothetical protein